GELCVRPEGRPTPGGPRGPARGGGGGGGGGARRGGGGAGGRPARRRRRRRGAPGAAGGARARARAGRGAWGGARGGGGAAGWGVLIGMASFPLMLGLLHVAGAADVLADPASQTGRLRELAEARGVAAMLFVAVFQAAVTTALSEEILFRGFLAKRLVSRLGFGAGNTLQALVFGAVHGVLLTGTATETSGPSPAVWAAVVLLPAVQGWLMGWLNERLAGGSIVPGWC